MTGVSSDRLNEAVIELRRLTNEVFSTRVNPAFLA